MDGRERRGEKQGQRPDRHDTRASAGCRSNDDDCEDETCSGMAREMWQVRTKGRDRGVGSD
jgi:hypothetical protein